MGNGRTNTWDSQNRLVSCLINGNTTTYRYGADGLRRQSTKNGVSTDSAYDGTMLVREGHAAGGTLTPSTVTATYFQGASGPCYRRDDTQTESDGQGHTFGKTRWYVNDGLGSVVGELDPLGNLTSSPKYDVYGAVRGNPGTATSKQGFVGSLGHISDDTGLIYMQARYYDPSMGRFVSEDPSLDGSNWFVYCGDNPVNMVDRDGKQPWPIFSQDAFTVGMTLAAYAAVVAIFTAPDNKAGAWLGTSLATLAGIAFSYAALGLLSPDMGQVMNNLKAYAGAIGLMVSGLQLGGRSSLPGAGIAATAAFVYGLALVGALAADDYDIG